MRIEKKKQMLIELYIVINKLNWIAYLQQYNLIHRYLDMQSSSYIVSDEIYNEVSHHGYLYLITRFPRTTLVSSSEVSLYSIQRKASLATSFPTQWIRSARSWRLICPRYPTADVLSEGEFFCFLIRGIPPYLRRNYPWDISFLFCVILR
jgi:hypothetical protein